MSPRLQRAGLVAAALFAWPLQPAGAAPFVRWKSSGSPTNRVDLVVVAEGYTADQLSKFQSDAAAFMKGVFAQEPYKTYANYYNVYFLLTPSPQSGADHPERGGFVDTAFDATYDCAGIQRLICATIPTSSWSIP
jgi:IgA Peptidase M64